MPEKTWRAGLGKKWETTKGDHNIGQSHAAERTWVECDCCHCPVVITISPDTGSCYCHYCHRELDSKVIGATVIEKKFQIVCITCSRFKVPDKRICLWPSEFNSRESCRKLHFCPKFKSHYTTQFYCGYLSVGIGIRRENDVMNWYHKVQNNWGSQSFWAGLLNDRDVN